MLAEISDLDLAMRGERADRDQAGLQAGEKAITSSLEFGSWKRTRSSGFRPSCMKAAAALSVIMSSSA